MPSLADSYLVDSALSRSSMPTSYANQQPAGFKNRVEKVAIVGAGGQSGKFITDALIKAGKHQVTAITRADADSANAMPEGLHSVQHVDYSDHASMVTALKGQDVLVVTLSVTAPSDTQIKLIDAAVEAGVKWIIPNEWGYDIAQVAMMKDTMLYDRLVDVRKHIEKTGGNKTRWIGLSCGFWYEFSLSGTEARYGFDFDRKT